MTEYCDVKFVDYGGYTSVKVDQLRQIRSDFMTLPFLAVDVYLSNVAPVDDTQWSYESCHALSQIITNKVI